MSRLAQLDVGQLERLLSDVQSKRLQDPADLDAITRLTGPSVAAQVRDELSLLFHKCGPAGVEHVLQALVAQQTHLASSSPQIDLVWSGPDLKGTNNQDTGTVVRTMFREAKHEVVLAGYAVYSGREIFAELGKRMDENPQLRVTLLLDIRPDKDQPKGREETVAAYIDQFRAKHWTAKRLPKIYYDPRAFEGSASQRAAIHAKFVVIDKRRLLVSSANFTPAAQERNIEVGVLLESEDFAQQLLTHVEQLIAKRHVLEAT